MGHKRPARGLRLRPRDAGVRERVHYRIRLYETNREREHHGRPSRSNRTRRSATSRLNPQSTTCGERPQRLEQHHRAVLPLLLPQLRRAADMPLTTILTDQDGDGNLRPWLDGTTWAATIDHRYRSPSTRAARLEGTRVQDRVPWHTGSSSQHFNWEEITASNSVFEFDVPVSEWDC